MEFDKIHLIPIQNYIPFNHIASRNEFFCNICHFLKKNLARVVFRVRFSLSLSLSLSLIIIRRLHYMNTGTRHYLNNVDWYFEPGIGFNIEIHQIKSKYLLPDFVVEKQVDSSDNNRILNIHGHKSLQKIPGEKLKETCPF